MYLQFVFSVRIETIYKIKEIYSLIHNIGMQNVIT